MLTAAQAEEDSVVLNSDGKMCIRDRFTGKKNWTVSGSQTDRVTVRLMRTLPSQSAAAQVNNAITNAGRDWAYACLLYTS